MKERLVKKLKTVSLFSLGFFFLSFPQSVSVSQFFGGLTIATSFPLFILDQEAQKTWKRIQNPFLFFSEFISFFFCLLCFTRKTIPLFSRNF
ncbi:hypothetical protein LEP1GSC123_3057 [Leptospira borgpetersenii str. 200701203]|uniref:Uncharacterized protein n=1 Tax=Leptospira borgpetersenii str. 200701203 TaxID=1193007 RepID=M3GD62_LEPBO|nr:hypothetical protein LEP1GSC123_3057 [Leptospira borgpetersenii str. 200701203]